MFIIVKLLLLNGVVSLDHNWWVSPETAGLVVSNCWKEIKICEWVKTPHLRRARLCQKVGDVTAETTTCLVRQFDTHCVFYTLLNSHKRTKKNVSCGFYCFQYLSDPETLLLIKGDMLGPPLPDVPLLSSSLDRNVNPHPAPDSKEKKNSAKKKCLFNYQDAFMEASEVVMATSSATSSTATTVQSSNNHFHISKWPIFDVFRLHFCFPVLIFSPFSFVFRWSVP